MCAEMKGIETSERQAFVHSKHDSIKASAVSSRAVLLRHVLAIAGRRFLGRRSAWPIEAATAGKQCCSGMRSLRCMVSRCFGCILRVDGVCGAFVLLVTICSCAPKTTQWTSSVIFVMPLCCQQEVSAKTVCGPMTLFRWFVAPR